MQPRPNASWNDGSGRKTLGYNRPNPQLMQALVGGPGQLPGHFRPPGVSTPHNLPSQIGYGPVDRGPSQNSAFTGGRVTSPLASLVHPQTDNGVQPFTPPSFGGGAGPAAPSLAPFVSTPQGGEPTHPVPGAGENTGAIAPQPQHSVAPTDSILSTLINPSTPGGVTAGTSFGGVGTGGPAGRAGGFAQTPSILATLLATLGQKVNPSAPGGVGIGGRYQV
jgi:hypothetical protein